MRGFDAGAIGALDQGDVREARALLHRERPAFSARRRLSRGQALTLASAFAAMAPVAAVSPDILLLAANGAALVLFWAVIGLKTVALVRHGRPARDPAPPLADHALPKYSIIAPLYREPENAVRLARLLAALDYPTARREILLVCEADDRATIDALEAEPLPTGARIVAIPPGAPRTKPKACAMALNEARGELIALFDAEDAPAPDQLRRAAAEFARGDARLAALQSKLVYSDARRNWLSRQFAIEYTALFDVLLPTLDALRLPIPLGGTGCHFRARALHAVGGWDPFNVTEDADLGYRFAALGYRVETLDSATEEIAASKLGPWCAQRTRWVKGYIQTLFVHTRDPVGRLRGMGPRGCVGFALVHLGALGAYYLYPALPLAMLLAGAIGVRALFDPSSALFLINVLMAAAGLLVATATAYRAARRRKVASGARLAGVLLSAPGYGLLQAGAALAAALEFVTRPFLWRKTPHPLPQETARRASPETAPRPVRKRNPVALFSPIFRRRPL